MSVATFRALKLYGMADVFDEAVEQGVRRKHTINEILADLCRVEEGGAIFAAY